MKKADVLTDEQIKKILSDKEGWEINFIGTEERKIVQRDADHEHYQKELAKLYDDCPENFEMLYILQDLINDPDNFTKLSDNYRQRISEALSKGTGKVAKTISEEAIKRIIDRLIEAIEDYECEYPDSYERGRRLPAFMDGMEAAESAVRSFDLAKAIKELVK